MTEEQKDILALYGVPGVGTKTFVLLIKHFGSADKVFSAPKISLTDIPGIGEKISKNILTHDRKGFIQNQLTLMEKSGASAIFRHTPEYPAQLDIFPSAPPVLFVRGDMSVLKKLSLAFVGTRNPSPYGCEMTTKLASQAVSAGLAIVSGMAAGIDSAAHRAAIESEGLTTAVFGCGVDIIYPVKNRKLAGEIIKNGCLVSHFPMGFPPMNGTFPARNSLIVGLSAATIVTEAPIKSGALITAELTLKTGRPLFSVPGNAGNPRCEGTNALFSKGALPAVDIKAVLDAIGKPELSKAVNKIGFESKKNIPPGLAGEIFKTLLDGPLDIEKISAVHSKPVAIILSALTILELEGMVTQKPGKIFDVVP